NADAVQPSLNGRGLEHELRNWRQFVPEPGEAISHRRGHIGWQVKAHTPRANETAPIAIPGHHHEHVQTLTAHPAEESRRWLVRHIAGNSTEVTDVVGE